MRPPRSPQSFDVYELGRGVLSTASLPSLSCIDILVILGPQTLHDRPQPHPRKITGWTKYGSNKNRNLEPSKRSEAYDTFVVQAASPGKLSQKKDDYIFSNSVLVSQKHASQQEVKTKTVRAEERIHFSCSTKHYWIKVSV